MLSLSTAWFAGAERPLDETFALLTQQGFRLFEFNHVVHPLSLEEVTRYGRRYGFGVSSLHNICSTSRAPTAPGDHYGDNLSSLDEGERRQSCDHLRGTAETALQLGAKGVVIHAGSVPEARDDPGYRRLRRAFARGEVEAGVVQREMRRRFSERRILGQPYLAQVIRSLAEVCPDYPELRFGLECRYHYYSLPDIDELGYVLDAVRSANVGYWHDCGHAQVQENLGLTSHEEWLRRYGDRLVGVHWHGMVDAVHDHAAPTPGNMPFPMIAQYVTDGVISVLELAAFNDLDRVVAGRDHLAHVLEAADAPGTAPR